MREKARLKDFKDEQNRLQKYGAESYLVYEWQSSYQVVIEERKKPIDFFPKKKLHRELEEKTKKRAWKKLVPSTWFGKRAKKVSILTKPAPRLVQIWKEWPPIVDEDTEYLLFLADQMEPDTFDSLNNLFFDVLTAEKKMNLTFSSLHKLRKH